MTIKEMTPELENDWFDFFENRAFSDHKEWRHCYCTFYYKPRLPEYFHRNSSNREYARWLIRNGKMKGYVVYNNNEIVGWCNVNAKKVYPALSDICTGEENVVSITCFVIEKQYRGKGIAHQIVDRIIADAKSKGVKIIEAYPRKQAKSEYGNYHGSYSMYVRKGFTEEKTGECVVLRKYL